MARKRMVVEGVGINDSPYNVTQYDTVNGKLTLSWICPFYKTWKSMLVRCYNKKYTQRYTTYSDVSVCKDWLTFSNFKSWMEIQDWEGKQLDKDILKPSSRIYSVDTCCFVDQGVNKFLTDSLSKRGDYLIGVDFHKESNKFRARCGNPIIGNSEFLGLFEDEQAAHNSWLKRKIELAIEIASTIEDRRVAIALVHRYENYYGWNKQ